MTGERAAAGVPPAALADARRLLQQGELDAAQRALDGLLAGEAPPLEALYLQAVCLRYREQTGAALAALEQLLQRAPEYARAHQERGHCHRARDEAVPAIEAYRRAVRLNPALLASWRALASLHDQFGATGAAREALAQAERLARLPRELVSVTSFLHEGKLYKAERLCRAYLKQHPRHVEAMRLLAALGVRLHILDDAEFLLESALTFEPDYLPARIDLVDVLQRRQKYQQALGEAERVRATEPDNPALQMLYANACVAAGRFDEALAHYDAERARQPDNASLHLARGHALKTVGRQPEAVAAYRQAAAVRPDFGDAFWSLANLKTYRFRDEDIDRMLAMESRDDLAQIDRIHLCFALGKAFEDAGEVDRSFHYYQRGNALKKAESRYSADRMHEDFERQKALCSEAFFAARRNFGSDRPDPIFIVGLPRAGSTLLEQILASHSQVDGTLELPNVLALVRRLQGRRRKQDAPRYPAVLSELNAQQCRQFGEDYLTDTAFHRQGAAFFTDKMPNNFRHIGLIHLMLPRARIIDARRDPMDCCFSCYRQLFAEGQEFTYDLTDVGRYYRDYVDLMSHWERVLPGRVLRVQHEEVLEDLEGSVRRLLDFCGLPFEQDCLDFYKTRRPVRTASSEQVRQPLSHAALARWRRFERHLTPLKAALGDVLAGGRDSRTANG